MRRGAAWAMALALCVGGTTACSDDGGDGGTAGGASTTTAATTGAEGGDDLTAKVDEFCAVTEQVQARFQEIQSDSDDPPTSEEEAEIGQLAQGALPLMMELQPKLAEMLPGDAARFQECAQLFGGGVTGPNGAVVPPG